MRKVNTMMMGAVLTACALSAGTAPGVLFEDGTFETPIPSFEDGRGWEAYGTPNAFDAVGYEDWANGAPGTGGAFGYADGSDGQFGLVFKGYSGSAGGFYHDVPVEPGRQYDFHIQSHTASTFYDEVVASGSGTVSIVFAWYDGDPTGSGALLDTHSNDITSAITDGGDDSEFPVGPARASRWQDWDYMLTAPAGATHLRATIQWSAPSTFGGGDETMRWDNAELTTALDPLNEAESRTPALRLGYNTQSEITYRVESAPDFDAGFADAGLAPVIGDGTPQDVFILPDANVNTFRLNAVELPIDPNFTVRPWDESAEVNWVGFMNVFNLPAPDGDGAFQWGSGWGVDDLVSDITSAPSGGNTVLTLSPNTIGDPNEYWYQDPTGSGNQNPGGPGAPGNKVMDANLYIEYNDTALAGQTVTFSGTVLANTLLPASHTAIAFIKDFAPDYSSNMAATTPLNVGAFSLSLDTDAGAGRHIQFGFTVNGPNVWVTDVAPFGNVQIAIEATAPLVLDEVNTSLELAPAPVVSWDSQLGVHYIVQSSDDGGANWSPMGGTIVGDGTRKQVSDRQGTVSGRTYRVVTPPAVPRDPA